MEYQAASHSKFVKGFRLSLMSTALLGVFAAQANDQAQVREVEVAPVEVVGTTPLSSNGVSIDKYSGNVQKLLPEEIENANSLNVSEILLWNVGGVSVNTAQNNPYQHDIFYRGFLASPLVGSAVGLSVYMDGVRINEGFGDTINWDMVPQTAISTIDVIPGSNPLYGLNTLGGALSMRTKSGRDFQGTSLETMGGSWGRWGVELEHGGYRDSLDWYLAANIGEEDGWRDRSPSKTKQMFGKLGWKNEQTNLKLSYLYNDNDLIGNGYAPERLLDLDQEAVHTFPDNTINESNYIQLSGLHKLDKAWQMSGNLFFRDYERSTINGDAETECVGNDDDDEGDDDEGIPPALCETGLEPGGEARTTSTKTDSLGGAFETTHTGQMAGRNNQLTVGVAYSTIDTGFIQTEAESDLQRFGNSVGAVNAEPQQVDVDIKTKRKNLGVYFTDTVDLSDALALNVSGRWQKAEIKIQDQTGEPENEDLNGDHSFNRFNPAAGVTYKINPTWTTFFNYSEGFRAPTAAELTCADPEDPCNLPNAFAADPPLDPVVAKTFEIGSRGVLGQGLLWQAAAYRTTLNDDLLFTIAEVGGAGFFKNIDKTVRQGVELGVNGLYDRLTYFANYAYVSATFGSTETVASVVERDGITVRSGDKIPGIPEHTFKLGGEYRVANNFWLGGNMLASSGSHLRGDESNKLPETAGYAVFNLNARMNMTKSIQLWVKLDNLFDNKYRTSGIRNFNANAGTIFGDNIEEERFAAPGAPRAAWVGVKARF